MNQKHLELCSSAEWAEAVERWIIPWVLDSVDLGDDVLEVGPGPGLTTDIIRHRVKQLTAVEIHPDLASSLKALAPTWTSSAPTQPLRTFPTTGSRERCALADIIDG
jgi:hypothetical protein